MNCPFCNSYIHKQDYQILYRCENCNKIIIDREHSSIFPHIILKDLIKIYDFSIFYDKLRIKNIIKDITKNEKVQNIIFTSLEYKLFEKLVKNDVYKNTKQRQRILKIKYDFSQKNYVYKELSDYIIESYLYALNNNYQIPSFDIKWFISIPKTQNYSKFKTVIPPEIKYLRLKEEKVLYDKFFTLEYEINHAERAFINGIEIPVTGNEIKYKASKYQKFILKAENQFYDTSKSIEIIPVFLPKILEFRSNKEKIKIGESIRIDWKIEYADEIELIVNHNQRITIQNQNFFLDNPTITTTYELIVTSQNENYVISKKILIEVIKPVEILFFKTNKKRIVAPDTIVLSWQIQNAKSIILQPINKDVSHFKDNRFTITVSKSSTFRIVASNEFYEEEKSIFIIVHQLPEINKITLPQPPELTISLPYLNLNNSLVKKNKILIEEKKWYNKLYTLEIKSLYLSFDHFIKNFTNKTITLLKRSMYE